MNYKDMSDQELLAYSLDAASYFLKSNNTHIYHARFNGLSLEDIAQEALLKIVESDVHPKTKTYVIEVVSNTCLNLLKRRKLQYEDTSTVTDERKVPMITVDDMEDFLIEHLDDDDRLLYALYAVQGLPQEDIAEVLGVSTRTVHRRVVEMRTTIQDLLS